MTGTGKISRRDVLRGGLAAGVAGAAAPFIVPSHVLGGSGETPPSDTVILGGIGVGRRGGTLINMFRHMDDASIAAVADVDSKRADEVASWVDGDTYNDYRRLLERDDIDGIVTATPDHWRALVCIHACQAGKDVYAEKPMTLTIAEGRKMAQAAEKYDIIWQTGSQQRSNATNRRGCELIRNGRIGKIKKVIAKNYPSPWKYGMAGQDIPDHIDWDRWCGPVDPVPYHPQLEVPRGKPGWLSFRRFAGGEMTGWGAHGFDQVQWALGASRTGPVEVGAEGEPFDPPTYTEPEGRSRGNEMCSAPKVYMRYPNDVVMELGDAPGGGAVFIGEEGTITIGRGSLKSDPPELAEEPLENPEVQLYESDNHGSNWLECIKTREKTAAPVEVGHRSATVCHLGNIARWTGRRLQWDPDTEQFTNDAEANDYLDRERREGYRLPDRV